MKRKVSLVVYRINEEKLEFFVGRRPNGRGYVGQIWQYPTGSCELRESYDNCARRELIEELGPVKIKNFFSLDKFIKFKSERGSYVEKAFAVEIEREIKVDNREFDQYEWLDAESITKRLYFKSHKNVVNLAKEYISKKRYPKIFLFCGPGGGGKDSVIDQIQREFKFMRPKTYVTRPLRRDGKEWRIHVSENKFKQLAKEGAFIETNLFGGYWYATPKHVIEQALKKGQNVLIDIDINGLLAFRKIYSQVVSIFVWTQMSDLEKRLRARGCHSEEYIKTRMKISQEEIARKGLCDYIVENKDGKLDKTVSQVIGILKKEIHG